MKPNISRERLYELMSYDAETGSFIRKKGRFVKADRQTGTARRANGYHVVNVDRKVYAVHRLAWFYVHGTWPKEIDHIDGDRANNRISNLRPATRTQNNANARLRKDNRSGHKGVCWDISRNKWMVRVGKKSIGRFDTKDEAVRVRNEMAANAYGEFHRPG